MLLIRNGYLLDPSAKEEGTADILIDDSGLIAGIRRHASAEDAPLPEVPASCTADAAGCIVIPGLVDTHSHFRDPGQTEKEDIVSGAAAAAAGGYTHVVMMANTRPCIDSTPVLQDVLARGRKTAIDVQSCACLTKDMAGRELTDMEQLAAAGASGFTDDGRPVMDAELLTRGLAKAAALRLPVSLHEEDPAFLHGSGVNAGSRAAKALSAGGRRPGSRNLARAPRSRDRAADGVRICASST
jgi:dihydroorotase